MTRFDDLFGHGPFIPLHALLGTTPDCCSDNLPEHSGFRQGGERYTCPECHKDWVWVDDEAEGGYWAEAELL